MEKKCIVLKYRPFNVARKVLCVFSFIWRKLKCRYQCLWTISLTPCEHTTALTYEALCGIHSLIYKRRWIQIWKYISSERVVDVVFQLIVIIQIYLMKCETELLLSWGRVTCEVNLRVQELVLQSQYQGRAVLIHCLATPHWCHFLSR